MTPTDAFLTIVPPSNVNGPNQVQESATGAAASVAVFTGLAAGDRPVGRVFVTFEALTADCYVRFGSTTTTATSADNGLIIKAGDAGRVFQLDPDKHAKMDVYAASAGKIKWQVCSPPVERKRQ